MGSGHLQHAEPDDNPYTDGNGGATSALKSPIFVPRNGSSAIPSSSVIFGSLPNRDNVFEDAVQPPLKVDAREVIQPLRNHTCGAPKRFKQRSTGGGHG